MFSYIVTKCNAMHFIYLEGDNRFETAIMTHVIAYMLLITDPGHEREVIEEIRKIKELTECRAVYGEFDVFVRLEVPDLAVLDDIVTRVRQIRGMIHSKTLVGSP